MTKIDQIVFVLNENNLSKYQHAYELLIALSEVTKFDIQYTSEKNDVVFCFAPFDSS